MNKPGTTETEAFARYAGEVLTERPYKCRESLIFGHCDRCGQHISRTDDVPDFIERPCIAPDPIDCKDWNTAMRWRDWAVENDCDDSRRFFFIATLEDIWRSGDMGLCFEQWIICEAQPHHYIEAVVRLKERG